MIIRLTSTIFFDTTGRHWVIQDHPADSMKCQFIVPPSGVSGHFDVFVDFNSPAKRVAATIAAALSEAPTIGYIDLSEAPTADPSAISYPPSEEECLNKVRCEQISEIEAHSDVISAKAAGVACRDARIRAAAKMFERSLPNHTELHIMMAESCIESLFSDNGNGDPRYVP
jgi:hypothetical protein